MQHEKCTNSPRCIAPDSIGADQLALHVDLARTNLARKQAKAAIKHDQAAQTHGIQPSHKRASPRTLSDDQSKERIASRTMRVLLMTSSVKEQW